MDQHPLIGSRNRSDLCEARRSPFEDVPGQVMLDRWQGEARQRGQAVEREGRGPDSRTSWVPRSDDADPAELDGLAEVLAAPLVELFQAGLRAGTLLRGELPAVVEMVCAEVGRHSLDLARLQEGDAPDRATPEAYAALVVGRVRRAILAALEPADV